MPGGRSGGGHSVSAPPPFLRKSPVPTQGLHTGPTGDFRCFCFVLFLFFLCMKLNIFQTILSSSRHPLPSPKPGIPGEAPQPAALVYSLRLCFPGEDQHMSEVLSPEILESGIPSVVGMTPGEWRPPAPAPSLGGEPAMLHYSVGRQDSPRPPANAPPLGTLRPRTRGWAVLHLYIYAHLVCS